MKVLFVDSMAVGDEDATGRTLDHILNNILMLKYWNIVWIMTLVITSTVDIIYENKKKKKYMLLYLKVYIV